MGLAKSFQGNNCNMCVYILSTGKPILTDAQFDSLKSSLKASGSLIAVSTEPKCYLDSGLCKVIKFEHLIE